MRERIRIDWSDLPVYLAVLRASSLTGAGKKLGMNQSTAGRRLARLEAAAGAQLFHRTPDGYQPTLAGERIRGLAERLEETALALERALTGAGSQPSGAVRVTTTEAIGAAFLAAALPVLRREHPGIDLELVIESRTLSLSRQEADVALRLARPRQVGLVARKLAEVPYGLYASAAYLAERGRPSASGDLTGHDLLAVDESLLDLPEARWLAARAGSARVVLRTNSTLAQLEAARAGLGLALLPRFLCEVAGLERASPPSQGITRQLWLAVHPDLQHAARVRAVIDFLAARAGWLERGPWRSRVPR